MWLFLFFLLLLLIVFIVVLDDGWIMLDKQKLSFDYFFFEGKKERCLSKLERVAQIFLSVPKREKFPELI